MKATINAKLYELVKDNGEVEYKIFSTREARKIMSKKSNKNIITKKFIKNVTINITIKN